MNPVDFKEFMKLVAHTGVSESEKVEYITKSMRDVWDISSKTGKTVKYTAAPVNPFGSSKTLGIPKLPEPEIDIPF